MTSIDPFLAWKSAVSTVGIQGQKPSCRWKRDGQNRKPKKKAGERMKKLAALLTVGAALSLPTVSWAVITGSPHDFQGEVWNTRQTVCGVCHSIHNTDAGQLVPLWTHATTAATFTPYSSGTLNATVGQPDGASKACLSCHDGTVAINSYGGRTGTEFVDAAAQLGTDLSNDHPISFTFDAALAAADGSLNDPTTTTVPVLGNRTIQQAMLTNNKMQCSSCHDIHKVKGTSSTSGIMVVISGSAGAGSKLCLTCHAK